jgi:hypothetical protein
MSIQQSQLSPDIKADKLTTTPSSYVATLLAGEAISIRDAVCLDLDYAGAYRVFKSDYTKTNRHTTHIGFATAAATVTPKIQTITISAAWTTGTWTYTLNGQTLSTPFGTSNDVTLAALATQIATNSNIASAVVTDAGTNDRVITVTGVGGIPITFAETANTTGITFTVAQTQAYAGQPVTILRDGPLAGFSGLTVGAIYYVGNTAGSITNAPSSTNPVRVGQAIGTDTIWATPKTTIFATPVIFVESHGITTGAVLSATTNHFNFTSWSAQTADGTAAQGLQSGANSLGIYHEYVDSMAAAETSCSLYHSRWNKSAWATATNRTTPRLFCGIGELGGSIHFCKGIQTGVAVATAIDVWNATSWTAGAGTMAQSGGTAAFVQGGYVHSVGGGNVGGAVYNSHETWNGSAVGSATVYPQSTFAAQAGTSGSGSSGFIGSGTSSYTGSYVWNGSSWSSVITMYLATNSGGTANNPSGGADGYNPGANMNYIAGATGYSTTTQKFNNAAWSADIAMGTGKTRNAGACI